MTKIKVDSLNTTDGLSSAYQVSQLTGAISATVITTAGLLVFGTTLAVPDYIDPVSATKTESVQSGKEIKRGLQSPENDLATAVFNGPLGFPRSHSDRAALLLENYQAAPDEIEMKVDIPDDLY